MSWFSGVPSRVAIAGGHDFLPAQQAICDEYPTETDDWLGAPGDADDWGATAVLILARLQLDQMVEIVQRFPLAAGHDWRTGLLRTVSAPGAPGVDRDDLDCVVEGAALWEALQGSAHVGHGFAIDGSISITFGPDIPESPALGLRGSSGGEMNDDPVDILGSAVACTRAAARLLAALSAAERGTGRNP